MEDMGLNIVSRKGIVGEYLVEGDVGVGLGLRGLDPFVAVKETVNTKRF